jgi:thiamine pyrophosphokinase
MNTLPPLEAKFQTGVAFITSGPLPRTGLKKHLQRYSRRIAVDGGLRHLQALHLQPDLAIGDFDSIPAPANPPYPLITQPSDKDQTDLELALHQELTPHNWGAIFGSVGGRIDHSATHLLLLARHPTRLFFISPKELVFAFQGTLHLNTMPGQMVSLIPLYGPTRVRTEGLHWELHDEVLDLKRIGISNRCEGRSCTIAADGVLLCSLHRAGRREAGWW